MLRVVCNVSFFSVLIAVVVIAQVLSSSETFRVGRK